MSFDWQNYLTLAQYMMDTAEEFPETEACYRSVVSRAYYAMFCMTRDYVSQVDGQDFYSNDHRALQDYLTNHPHRVRQKIGNQLRRLHQHRKKADYDRDLGEAPVNKATKALYEAQKVLEGLTQIYM